MAQAVSRRPLTAETGVRSWSQSVWVFSGQSGTVTAFCHSASVFSRQYHSSNAPYSYLNITVIRRTSGRSLGNLRKQDIREHVDWKGLFYGLQRFRGISTLSTSGNYVYRVINIRWHVRSAFVWFVWRSGHTAIFSPISSIVNGWMFVMKIRGSLWGEN